MLSPNVTQGLAHRSQLTQIANELKQANDNLFQSIFAINKESSAELQHLVIETMHLSTSIANTGDAIMLTAGQGRNHYANIYNVKVKQKTNTTESEKQQMISVLEAVDHLLTSADTLLKDLQACYQGDNKQFELSVIQASQVYFELVNDYKEKFPGFDTLIVVSRSEQEIQHAAYTFAQSILTRITRDICQEFSAIVTARKRRQVEDIKSYFETTSLKEMLYSNLPAIGFLKKISPEGYSFVRALVVLVFYELTRGSISFLEDNMHEGIAAPDMNLLRGLNLRIYELSYRTICYPDNVPIDRRAAAERENATKAGKHASSPGSATKSQIISYASQMPKEGTEYLDKALGYYFLAITIYIQEISDILSSVFFADDVQASTDATNMAGEFSVVLDPILNTQFSSRESLELFIELLRTKRTSVLLTGLTSLSACLGMIFHPVIDYLAINTHYTYFLELEFTRNQSYLSSLKRISEMPKSYFSTVQSRPLTHILEGVLNSNPLYGFSLYIQIDHMLSVACELSCNLVILLLSSALLVIDSHILSFTDTFHAHLSKLQPVIKQAGVFPGTMYTCMLLSAIHAMYCSATLTVKTMSAKSAVYKQLYGSLKAYLPQGSSGSISFEQPHVDENTFALLFKLDSGHMKLLKIIINPYLLVMERFEKWLDAIISADKANTEKYRDIVLIENLSFLMYFCDSLLERNFEASIQMELKNKIKILLTTYVESNIEYKFCENSSKDVSWVKVVDRMEEVVASGIQLTDIQTQTGLSYKDVEKAIKSCNATIKKQITETFDRFFKHINLKAGIANCSSIVAVARIREGTLELLKQISDAFCNSIKSRYSLFVKYSEQCYTPPLNGKLSLSVEDVSRYCELEFEKMKRILPS